MGGEVQIARMEVGALAKGMAEHSGLEVVDEDGAGRAAEELEGVVMAAEEVFERLAAGELDIGSCGCGRGP